MKRNIVFALFIASLAFVSCEKETLNTTPTDAVSEDLVLSTTKNQMALLNGIYRAFYSQYSYNGSGQQDQGGQSSMMINLDMLGEDLVQTAQGNGWYNSIYKWDANRNSKSSTVIFAYRFYYKIIGSANKIIQTIDQASGTDAEKKQIKGEALGLRAWSYFQLVQIFGKRYDASAKPNVQLAVPLLTSFNLEGQPRATVEQVYTQINKDLDEAVTLLSKGAPENNVHFNLNAAYGVKARVALTMQDWANAASYAVQARAGFSLMSGADLLKGFNSYSNSEWMWCSHQIDDQTTYFYSFFAYMSANFNSSNIRANPKAINKLLYAKIASTDTRKQWWDSTGATIPVPPSGLKKAYANKKFLAKSSSSSVGDVPYMRLAEMYLIEAEAQARLGNDASAAAALYTLAKNRNPSYVLSTRIGQDLINEILVQRRVELWGEGFRFFDLKRLNWAMDRTGTNHDEALAQTMTVPAGDKKWQFLIPDDEINANQQIVQNDI